MLGIINVKIGNILLNVKSSICSAVTNSLFPVPYANLRK